MITKDQAMTHSFFEHAALRGADKLPLRCRATGHCQTWKTRPEDFKLPVKYGLYQSFYLTPRNAEEWSVPSCGA